MSIVGVAIEGEKVIIVGDTRVIFPSKVPKEVHSRFEFVVKIFKITDNTIIWVVGDYNKSTMKLIKKIQNDLNKPEDTGRTVPSVLEIEKHLREYSLWILFCLQKNLTFYNKREPLPKWVGVMNLFFN